MTQPETTQAQLLAALRHPNDRVRAGAAAALGGLAGAAGGADGAGGAPPGGQLDVVEPLVTALADPAAFVREAAARGLARLGLPAVGALLDLIQTPPFEGARALASTALGLVRDPQAVELLCIALSYPEPEARLGAAVALGELADPDALLPLAEAARHEHLPTAREACLALGKLQIFDIRILKAAAALLQADAWQLRAVAVQTLGVLARLAPDRLALPGPEQQNTSDSGVEEDLVLEMLQPLLTALQDPLPDIRYQAAEALRQLRRPIFGAPLQDLLRTGNSWVRQNVAVTLGYIPAPGLAAEMYQIAYEDPDPEVRLHAAQALVRLGDERGRTLLLRPLKAPNTLTRQLAAIALGELGDIRAAETLLAGLEEKWPQAETPEGRRLRARTIEALAAIGPPAIPLLIRALSSPVRDAQKAAVQALARIGPAAALELCAALEKPGRAAVALRLVQALEEIRDPRAIPTLESILRRAVGRIGFAQAFSRAIYDPDAALRVQAAAALAAIGAPTTSAALLLATRYDPDEEVRQQAGRGLAWVGAPQAILAWAGEGIYTILRRALVGLAWLLAAVGLCALALERLEMTRFAYLVGLILGGGFGFAGGWAARRQVIQGLVLGGLAAGAAVALLHVGLTLPIPGPEGGLLENLLWLALLLAAAALPTALMVLNRGAAPLWLRLTGLFAGMITGFAGGGAGVIGGWLVG